MNETQIMTFVLLALVKRMQTNIEDLTDVVKQLARRQIELERNISGPRQG